MNLFVEDQDNALRKMVTLADFLLPNTNHTLHHPKVKKLVESGSKFDAVVMEHFSNHGLKVFAHVFNCPLILLNSIGPNGRVNPTVGNPQPISYIRQMYLQGDSSQKMSFIERCHNLILHILEYLTTSLYSVIMHDRLVKSAFPTSPDLHAIFTNASLVLLNSHTSLYAPQPLVPNMVEVGGYHVDPPKKLPEDLQRYLDDAKEGVIFFSMGTNLKSKDITDDKKKIFLKVLGGLKQKVLWKFEEELSEKPRNMLIKKWLPQQDILAHPNVKLFISHTGFLSLIETVHYGVPILAIPVFGDQLANAKRAVAGGYGLEINYNDEQFTEEYFSRLVHELLNNPKYTENAKKVSKLYHDRPMKPMETAIYWIEYVIRNNGAVHLRVAGVDQPWYQYFMIDVTVFLSILVFSIANILKFVITKLLCSTRSNPKKLKSS